MSVGADGISIGPVERSWVNLLVGKVVAGRRSVGRVTTGVLVGSK